MTTLIDKKHFDLLTEIGHRKGRVLLWLRFFNLKKVRDFEILINVGPQLLCLDLHRSFIEIRILKVGIKFWTNK